MIHPIVITSQGTIEENWFEQLMWTFTNHQFIEMSYVFSPAHPIKYIALNVTCGDI